MLKPQTKEDYHLFQTDHPYFIEMGLGTFTTGTLLQWWNQKDRNGLYLNRRHFNFVTNKADDLATPAIGLRHALGIANDTEFSMLFRTVKD